MLGSNVACGLVVVGRQSRRGKRRPDAMTLRVADSFERQPAGVLSGGPARGASDESPETGVTTTRSRRFFRSAPGQTRFEDVGSGAGTETL
jgi:hypothetical protein